MIILSWGRKTGKTTFCINRYKQCSDSIIFFVLSENMRKIVYRKMKMEGVDNPNVHSIASGSWFNDKSQYAIIDDAGFMDVETLKDVLGKYDVDTITVSRVFDKSQMDHPIFDLVRKHGFHNRRSVDCGWIDAPTDSAVFSHRDGDGRLVSDGYTRGRLFALYCINDSF